MSNNPLYAYTVGKEIQNAEITEDFCMGKRGKMDNYYGNICYCRRCNGVVHTIKKGDTLYLISKYYKVPIGEIMNANRNINIYNLQIGDEICIPVRRPEPRESDMTQRQIPYMNRNTENMEDSNNTGNTVSETENMVNNMSYESDVEAVSTDAKDISINENERLADVLSREDMTVGEFVKFMRKFDKQQ